MNIIDFLREKYLNLSYHDFRRVLREVQLRVFPIVESSLGDDELLRFEVNWYNKIGKLKDDEDHLSITMRPLYEVMSRRGARHNASLDSFKSERGVGLIFHSPSLLAHTQVVLWLLSCKKARAEFGSAVYCIVLNGANEEFQRSFQREDVKVIFIDRIAPQARHSVSKKISALRSVVEQCGIGQTIWISSPPGCSFFFSARISRVQTYWTMKLHSLTASSIDYYIGCGTSAEPSKIRNGVKWNCKQIGFFFKPFQDSGISRDAFCMQLNIPDDSVCFGAFAREEKFEQLDYLNAVCSILREVPNSYFLWTGRTRSKIVQDRFERLGLGSRTRFLGWINTAEYIQFLDVFLETFPFGCGQTAFEAAVSGIPIVEFSDWTGLLTMHGGACRDSRKFKALDALICSTAIEYVETAVGLGRNVPMRRQVGLALSEFAKEVLLREPDFQDSFYFLFNEAFDISHANYQF